MKRVIGITGGIGAGKSEVLSLLQSEVHADIILADTVAHELMEPGKLAYERIIEQFGTDFLMPDGTINRKRFAESLFCHPEMLEQVDGIVHPLVKEEIRRRVNASKAEWVAVEAALLIEENYQGDICEELWYVYSPREERIRRLMEHRGYTREKCESIMKNQLSDEAFRQACNQTIENTGGRDQLLRELNRVISMSQRNACEKHA